MLSKHESDFIKYGDRITEILESPDYVGINPKDQSIEYVKEISEFVKVAVRVSATGVFYARSLYTLSKIHVNNYISKGALKPLTNRDKSDIIESEISE